MYKNGEVLTTTLSGSTDMNNLTMANYDTNTNQHVHFGGRHNDASGHSKWVEALYDEISIWSKKLTPSEISSIYNGGTVTNLSLSADLAFNWRLENNTTATIGGVDATNNNCSFVTNVP